jgi:chromosome segregation ATPase
MQCKCVTYDGDVYEPGTMTGGSDMNTQFILPRYRDLRLIDEKIQQLKEEYDYKHKLFQDYNERLSRYNNLEKDV